MIQVDDNTQEKATKHHGVECQVDVAIEEMSELIKALIKERRAMQGNWPDLPKAMNDVVEEIADVYIMLSQLIMIYDYNDWVQAEVYKKIERLAKRLKKAERKESI